MRASFAAVVALVAAVGLNSIAFAKESPLDKKSSLQIGVKLIDQETKDFLAEFQQDQAKAMNKKKQKFDASGMNVIVDSLVPASKGAALKGDGSRIQGVKTSPDFVDGAKDQALSQICNGFVDDPTSVQCLTTDGGRRAIAPNDNAANLVDNARDGTYTENLFTMAEGLTSGVVDVDKSTPDVNEQPWSSDYWAIASGILAKRYSDPSWPNLDWHKLRNYWTAWFNANGANLDAYINQLSPAEKYDIVVGDTQWNMTNASLNAGEPYAFDRNGQPRQVETWMGICHGWAPAAYMDKRPVKTVTAYSPSNKPVAFTPDDIKALSVLKWANGKAVKADANGRLRYSSKFIGGRCNLKDGQIDRDASGAVRNEECFDTNPGAWHKAIVNQIGIKQNSFVLDVTFDYEVWNQPLVRYSYTYFDPATMQPSSTLRGAMKRVGEFTDRFAIPRQLRNSGASHVVGVIMQASYVVETNPTGAATDSAARDAIRSVRYVYDLELAEDGRILGGEWYENTHPDFLWTPEEGSFAYNEQDENVTSWSHEGISGDAATNLTYWAQQASARNIPLKAVVDGLLEAASRP